MTPTTPRAACPSCGLFVRPCDCEIAKARNLGFRLPSERDAYARGWADAIEAAATMMQLRADPNGGRDAAAIRQLLKPEGK